MSDHQDLGALIVSRICHDLISPLSAIGNGVELLEMTTPPRPELALISESVENAIAKIRFFRFAFGAASKDQPVGRPEIVSMLDALSRSGRLRYGWEVAQDMPRDRLKLAMLLAACTEQALPQGGRIVFAGQPDALRLSAHGPKVRPKPEAWEHLRRGTVPPEPRAGEAQFAIAAAMLRLSARPLWIETGEHGIEIGF
ncbi:histidine phosphotransferase family protein [Limimaricola sp.]|uniref:histidine phosphotransferase family protein n=1 Tax=Limimaricola sp. TaxID=2211665 RepID=UPI0040587B3D